MSVTIVLLTFCCISGKEACEERVDRSWGDVCQDFLAVGIASYSSASTRSFGDVLLLACVNSITRKRGCESKSDLPAEFSF